MGFIFTKDGIEVVEGTTVYSIEQGNFLDFPEIVPMKVYEDEFGVFASPETNSIFFTQRYVSNCFSCKEKALAQVIINAGENIKRQNEIIKKALESYNE